MNRTFICRYGSQDIYRLLGRDPIMQPLTALEIEMMQACLQEHVTAERRPYVEAGLPAPEKSG